MTTDNQLALLRTILGEPDDANEARFTATQLLNFLNLGRKWLCEYSRCFQVKDSQTTQVGVYIYNTPIEVIGFHAVEYNGIPLDPISLRHWRDQVGDDDTIQGIPFIYKYFAKQIQLFYAPQEAKTLMYEGWGYAIDLVSGGDDVDLNDYQNRGAIFYAGFLAKGSDKRNESFEYQSAMDIAENLRKQHRPKGPRYIRDNQNRISINGRLYYGS